MRGRHVRGFVDGKVVTDGIEPSEPDGTAVFASATYVTPTREVVVKVVNMGA